MHVYNVTVAGPRGISVPLTVRATDAVAAVAELTGALARAMPAVEEFADRVDSLVVVVQRS